MINSPRKPPELSVAETPKPLVGRVRRRSAADRRMLAENASKAGELLAETVQQTGVLRDDPIRVGNGARDAAFPLYVFARCSHQQLLLADPLRHREPFDLGVEIIIQPQGHRHGIDTTPQ